MVLPKSAKVPFAVTAGGETVGIRWPSHPFIQAVIRACGFPLAAPSANRSTGVSPTNAAHVVKSLGDRIPLVVDGGQSQVGIESTVLDVTINPPRVLRPGMIREESLLAVTGALANAECGMRNAEPLRSPGLLERHYSPKARLMILSWHDDAELRGRLSVAECPFSGVHVIAHTRVPSGAGFGQVSVIPRDAQAFARAIYAELHRCDEAGAKVIVVEELPQGVEWEAIRDRLRRAAA